MTVMLLQRFTTSQSTFALKKTKYLSNYEVGTDVKTQPFSFHLENSKNNQQQISCDNDSNLIKESNIDCPIIDNYYCISNNSNNNNINNSNNNYSERTRINDTIDSCKSEKLRRSSGCCHSRAVASNNNNNSNSINNNCNNNNNDDEDDNDHAEEDKLLARNKINKRQETITSGGTTYTLTASGTTGTTTSSASQSRFCEQGVAMRYYRLWIYACNIVLLGSALGLAAAVAQTLLFSGDPRRYLIPGVPRALDPTALYAYLALATQLGLVQLLGCIAARRLSARLLNAYWVLLLALLFGDTVIGVAWVFRFERMRAELRPTLRLRLQLDYGKDSRFSEQWDRLQKDFSCCGIVGPVDFDSRSLPNTCCPDVDNSHNSYINDDSYDNYVYRNSQNIQLNETTGCQQPFNNGCEESLMSWLRKTADLLFVLGFCVIAFAKLCFLGILRYEIREMIQKIRLLREPPPPATSTFIQSFCQPATQSVPIATVVITTTTTTSTTTMTTMTTSTLPGGSPYGPASVNITSNNGAILQPQQLQSNQEYEPKHPLLYTSNLQQDTGVDSDTNSHCALILEETTPTPTNHRMCNATREKNNGNNNYEMREFNRRYLMSNGASPPMGIQIIGQNKRT
ncbi:uncharacterized protein [Chelonus insularis]|uniref:uncharacterized protein isoform X2 n=1 Tax=Chelonus insularis TaxID=460826 RepID=UPI001588F509|nr:uncharacterized protein LOC118069445 isoform X2 [Chelonus insularis]